jgi:hypothetical protein
MWDLNVSQPYGPPWPLTGIGLPFFDPIFDPIANANIFADFLGNQFTPHDLCDCDPKPQIQDRFHDLLAAVDEDNLVKFRPSDT